MSSSWNIVIKQVTEKQLSSASWKSDRNTLLELFKKIQFLDVDPSPLNKASYSNLRTIIPSLKKATKKRDVEKINTLFAMASRLSNADLRLAVQTTTTEVIDVVENFQDSKALYILTIDRDQLERIKKSTKLYYDFKIISSH